VARRYGQRPSTLVQGTASNPILFKTDAERLWFDTNIALLSMANDIEKTKREQEKELSGPITSRRQARIAAEIAKRQVEEMERDAEGSWSVRSTN